jgi:hypothetical protein
LPQLGTAFSAIEAISPHWCTIRNRRAASLKQMCKFGLRPPFQTVELMEAASDHRANRNTVMGKKGV